MFIIIEKKSLSIVKSRCLFFIFALYQFNLKTMKRSLALVLSLIAFAFSMNAQQFVITDVQKRNVLLEEYTGINCPNCPDGHKYANQLVEASAGKVWAVNIHAGNYSSTSYPNFKTDDGTAIYAGANVTGFPQGNINRSTESALGRVLWAANATDQMKQNAECNIGGQVFIDKENRTATIMVEVYYTGNSAAETNYLNIYMLQNNILGYQSGSSENPDQIVNGKYNHMHILRDVVTSTWGDAITPTTAGTLITKTYEYQIPQTIGSPNGVDVDLDELEFLAFVTEQYQGVGTKPILNVNELVTFSGSNDDVYAYISGVTATDVLCANEKMLNVNIVNGGYDNITSIDFRYSVDGGEYKDYRWEGEALSHNTTLVTFPIALTEGTHNVKVELVKANGVELSSSETISVTNETWTEVKASSDKEELTIELMQDKYGSQITWELIDDDYAVVASGGPYENLKGSSASELHEIKVLLSAGDCVKFIIKDSKANGICCQYGEGYYRILDSKGNVVVDGKGAFGEEASHVLSIVKDGDFIAENTSLKVELYPNPTNGNLNINAKSMTQISVINTLGQVLCNKKVNSDSETIDMSQYEDGIYMVRVMTEEGVVTRRVTVVK